MTMPLRPCASCSKRFFMASRSPAPSLRLTPLNLPPFPFATACWRTSQPGDLPSWGRATPTSRDESALNKTACHVESRKSLQKTEMDGRNPHRAVRFHSRIGFTSHERELLLIPIQKPTVYLRNFLQMRRGHVVLGCSKP